MTRITNAERAKLFGRACTPANHRLYVTPWGLRVQVHKLIAARFAAACVVAHRESRWRPQRIDSYNCRTIRGGDSYSTHAWAMAFDFFATGPNVPPPGGVWTPDNPPDARFIAAFTELGFTWGGTFQRRDLPHFEWAAAPPAGADTIAAASRTAAVQPAPSPTPAPPMEATGMNISTHYFDIVAGPNGAPGLDGNGWGTLVAPFPFERVVSVCGQSLATYPTKAVVCVYGPEGGGTKIQVQGASRQGTGVWVKVLDA